MKSRKKIISLLNEVLKSQLAISNQYLMHSQLCRHQKMEKLYQHEKNELIDRAATIDDLIGRILTLGGQPALQNSAKLCLGKQPIQILQCNLSVEKSSVQQLKTAISGCLQYGDRESADVLLIILDEVESQIDWLETQIELSDTIGEINYLRMQASQSILEPLIPPQKLSLWAGNATSTLMSTF